MNESILQTTLVSMIRTLYPEFVINLSLNGISLKGLSPVQRSQLIAQAKREGLETGIPDLSIYIPNKVLNFELKVGKNKQSEDQVTIEQKLNKLGHNYYVIRDVYQAFQIFAECTTVNYRMSVYNYLIIPHYNGKLVEQFLHFPEGTNLTEVEQLIKSLYQI